ncbi:MAG: aminotransferase class I/II-fold pyridoxal phosphate-dependent enzyme [bacterium]|nr:aminotransferase class I/II-fold pyridoxal phosphate-dependent enzyme [bacterium]
MFFRANRMQKLPPYLFAGLEAKAEELKSKGIDIIDLGIGDPDLPPPKIFTDAIKAFLELPNAHLYPTSIGDLEVRKSIARWMKVKFQVEVDPKTQICVLIGAKEGLANLARAFVNSDDQVAVPDPAYPVYANGATILSDGIPVYLPLFQKNQMLLDVDLLDQKFKMVYLNYPNNPTGAIATNEWFSQLSEWAKSNSETIVVHDNAYSELTFYGYKAPSWLQFYENGIEFFSLSKMVNATGFRIGFAVGHPEIIQALVKVKTQLDSGAPLFIQLAMKQILDMYDEYGNPPQIILENLNVYGERRNVMEQGLTQLGMSFVKSPATFYVWTKVPDGWDDLTFTEAALEKGVILTPGRGFGNQGKNYVRFALTQSTERILAAIQRLKTL